MINVLLVDDHELVRAGIRRILEDIKGIKVMATEGGGRAEGKTSAEIAMILSISENTVNFHQKNMQKKINAPNKTQVACYAAATGLI